MMLCRKLDEILPSVDDINRLDDSGLAPVHVAITLAPDEEACLEIVKKLACCGMDANLG